MFDKVLVFCVFFFSSRRRHTRFDCDWSSDVCSSDLKRDVAAAKAKRAAAAAAGPATLDWTDPVNAGHPDLLPISSGKPFHKMEMVNRQFPGELVYADAFEEFVWEDGDTLCGIAAAQ